MVSRRMTRDERRLEIVRVLQEAKEPLTYIELGRAMGMKATPYLRELVDDLLKDELLIRTIDNAVNGAPRFLFSVPSNSETFLQKVKLTLLQSRSRRSALHLVTKTPAVKVKLRATRP